MVETYPVLEHALLAVRPGSEAEFEAAMVGAVPLIACQPGFGGIEVRRCVERPSTYLLLVRWTSVEAHEEGFRKSPEYAGWREALHRFYDPLPVVEHFTSVLESPAPEAV